MNDNGDAKDDSGWNDTVIRWADEIAGDCCKTKFEALYNVIGDASDWLSKFPPIISATDYVIYIRFNLVFNSNKILM
jgi:hypothetical protein